MKFLMKIWYWLKRFFTPVRSDRSNDQILEKDKERFRFIVVEEIPESIEKDCVYILNEGFVDEAIYFVCPCGCNAIIELNLLEDSSPLWKYATDNGKITISPSVWRTIECKSHFFIHSGKIQWAQNRSSSN